MGDALVAHIDRYLDWPGFAQTVTHGDYRLDNLLFAPGERTVIVDWQTVGKGSGLSDLAYLIGTSIADPAARAASERQWVGRYLAKLEQAGISAEFDSAWTEYRVFAFSGFIMAVFASMNVERTQRGDEMFAVMAERPARQALHLDSLTLLQA
jgi:aminoglycoside phosphotransferase (APT) family kinase protein